MIYAILSDIHANLEALERVLRDAAQNGARQVVCLGDSVGYGPRPREVLARIRASASIILAGNHDDAVSGRLDASDFIDLAGGAVQRHRAELEKADLAFLRALPYTADIEGAICSHGDLTNPPAFNYVDNDQAARANFDATDVRLILVGHTHTPELYVQDHTGEIYQLKAQDFAFENDKRYLVNVGSVGYPRESNGACYSSYVLYDSAAGTLRFRFLPFSVASVMSRETQPTPSPKHPALLLVGAVLVGLMLALGIMLLKPATRERHDEAAVERVDTSVLTNRTIFLTRQDHHVAVNLRLVHGSPAAHLTIEFEDAYGKPLAPLVEVIQSSSKRTFPAPPKASQATFIIRPYQEGFIPKIQRFEPRALP